MRLICPSCQTDYDVPDAALTGRSRKLRCATCGTLWEAGPIGGVETVPVPVANSVPEPVPVPRGVEMDYARLSPEAVATAAAVPPVVRRDSAPPLPDPDEARHRADRESFAALLEASRKAGSQNAVTAVRYDKTGHPQPRSRWVAVLLVLLLAGGLVFLERAQIMAAWPPSVRFFAALGVK